MTYFSRDQYAAICIFYEVTFKLFYHIEFQVVPFTGTSSAPLSQFRVTIIVVKTGNF
jgi:hypothetical protein